MAFTFTFTSTHQDLLDSYEAYRTTRAGTHTSIYQLLIEPLLDKSRILLSNPPSQEVRLTLADSGMDILVVGVLSYQRAWHEVAHVISAPKGIGMIFTDRSAHWLPNRVFKDPGERAAVEDFIRVRTAPNQP